LPWRKLQAVEMAKLDWVDWFNYRQLPEPTGNVLPAEAESRLFFQTRWVCRRGVTQAKQSPESGAVLFVVPISARSVKHAHS
jgi:hypothetical protein